MNASKPLVYMAGPITGDPWGCVRRATAAAAELRRWGLLAYLPQLSVFHEMVDPQPYEHWIEHGLAMLELCEGLVRLTGKSPAADREVERAKQLGIPVITVDAITTTAHWVLDEFRNAVYGYQQDRFEQ